MNLKLELVGDEIVVTKAPAFMLVYRKVVDEPRQQGARARGGSYSAPRSRRPCYRKEWKEVFGGELTLG